MEDHKLCGKNWRPSNGTEGEVFIDDFCAHCIHEKFWHTQDHADRQCEILNKSLLTEDVIEEWVYDEDSLPKCTSHVKWDWDKGDDGNWNEPPPQIPYDPNQLVFPFEFEALENQTFKIEKAQLNHL